MAINPKLLALAADPAVQSTARTIFGWLNERRASSAAPAPTQSTDAQLHAMLRDVPTRADLATALAQIDVRIAATERRLVRTVVVSVTVATILLGALIGVR